MFITENDKQEITVYVLGELRNRALTLKEKALRVIIDKAINAYRQTEGEREYMCAVIDAELALIPALGLMRPRAGRIIDIDVSIASNEALTRLKAYCADNGMRLQCYNSGEYYVRVPSRYAIVDMRKMLRKIASGAHANIERTFAQHARTAPTENIQAQTVS